MCYRPQAVYQCEDESLWVWEDALLVLNLGLDIVNHVQGLDLKNNCLTHKCFNEDLHATMKTEDKVESQLLLNVIVQQGATVLMLLASKDEALLIGRNALLVLNLCFDVVNCIRRFDLKGDHLYKGIFQSNVMRSCLSAFAHALIVCPCLPKSTTVPIPVVPILETLT